MLLDLATAKRLALPTLAADGAGSDQLVSELLEIASAQLLGWLLWPAAADGSRGLERATYVEYIDRSDRSEWRGWTPTVQPVASVTSIREDPGGDRSYAATVSSSEYSLVQDELSVIWRPNGWANSSKYTRVEYVAGFTSDHRVAVAALAIQVRHLWDVRMTSGVAAVGTQQGSTTYSVDAGDIPPRVRAMLAPWRLPGRALA